VERIRLNVEVRVCAPTDRAQLPARVGVHLVPIGGLP
jgi:hypothetical protein